MGTATATWESDRGHVLGNHGEGKETVTENERRAQDLLSARDLIVRGLLVVGLIAAALLTLLLAQAV